jgi:hypothetical protein
MKNLRRDSTFSQQDFLAMYPERDNVYQHLFNLLLPHH